MKRSLLIIAVLASTALCGCSTINSAGIGGQPRLVCKSDGSAAIDDRLLGSDRVSLGLVRAFPDGASLCTPKVAQVVPAASPSHAPDTTLSAGSLSVLSNMVPVRTP
jgi:hypothetical protein